MKKFIYVLLVFLFLYPGVSVYSQEEFFGNQNGLSLSYLKVFDAQANGVGLSFYSKKGFIAGVGVENVYGETYPLASVLFCPGWDENPNELKVVFGFSYSNVRTIHIVGFNIGLIKCFFAASNFPFSINGTFSLQAPLGKQSEMIQDIIPMVGFGYTQAFFAHSRCYPFIGISNSFELKEKNNLYSATVGVNVRLGSSTVKDKNLLSKAY